MKKLAISIIVFGMLLGMLFSLSAAATSLPTIKDLITYGETSAQTTVKLTIGSTTAYINGEAKILDAAPINRNNRTMLPVRFLANALGVSNDNIAWDAATNTATLVK
ncbi:MAG: copper amine oxidase N-terminal domain-containing protein [Clostridia bacterium]|nr:copper amine oxidase N-terminal domain-containing protein [Clostridia bacterium]